MASECLDHSVTKQLGSLVETLTTSGRPVLDEKPMKELKKICRTSDLYVEHVFRLLMSELNTDHAEVRLSTSQIIDELFKRSHCFRELLVGKFQLFLELTVETDQFHQPLPPPKAAAQKMKTDTLRAIQRWQDKFGEAYKKLSLGYNYLKTCKHVNFSDIQARSLAEQQRREEQELRKQMAMAAKLEKVRKEFSELQQEISSRAMEAENCIELLLPKPDSLFQESDFSVNASEKELAVHSEKSPGGATSSFSQHKDIRTSSSEKNNRQSTENETNLEQNHTNNDGNSNKPHEKITQDDSKTADSETKHAKSDSGNDSDKNDDDSDESDFEDVDEDELEERGLVRTHGLGSRKYNLEIEIETDGVRLTETEDNSDLYRSLKDAGTLISVRHLPQVVRWLEVLSKTGGSETEIKNMIDLKVRLEHIRTKCTEMQLVSQPQSQNDGSDSDGDMEEVPEKEGYEPVIPAHLRSEYGLEPAPSSASSSASNKNGASRKAEKKHTSVTTSSRSSSKTSSSSSRSSSSSLSKSSSKSSASATDNGKGKASASVQSWTLKERNKAAVIHDPTSRAANLAKLGVKEEEWERPSTSSGKPSATVTSETAGSVPTMSFGPDLEHWGAAPDKIEAPLVVKNDSLHRFWVPAEIEHEKPSQNDIAAVLNRTFHFTGKFEPVKWKCRATLPNGQLCERMDRIKCPFHGKIIPRDEQGMPSNPEDYEKEKMEAQTETAAKAIKSEPADNPVVEEVPPWLDADLQAEIEAATGHDLGSQRSRALAEKAKGSKGKGKGKGKKKKKYEGLTDIDTKKNSTRARLEKKVFNKGSVKRVASALDHADYKRVRDKFGNQFNYAFK